MRLPEYISNVGEAAEEIRKRVKSLPDLAIILGTGLDKLADIIQVDESIPYASIPHFPQSTVSSHAGELVFGTVESRPVIAMRGRMHLYEGYSAWEVTFPIRVLSELGVRTLIVSNACGGMNPDYRAGDLMLIADHINLMGHNPLEGANNDEWGPRFPDMSDPYTSSLRELTHVVAAESGVSIHEGVYLAVVGPNLETRAEYRMLRRMGGDVVGMSTVPEVLVANHMDMSVLAISVITDECFPDVLQPVSLEDVLAAAAKASPPLIELLRNLIPRI
jgi:purine-nucleoside phosphorylase